MDSVSKKYGPNSAWNADLGHKISLHAHIYLSACEQHLCALQALLEQGISGIGLGPPARSVAEASGRVLWLLDSRLSVDREGARRRVARLMLDVEENARIYNGLCNKLDHPRRTAAGEQAKEAADAIKRPGMFYASEISRDQRTGAVALCSERLPGPSGWVRLAGELYGQDERQIAGYYSYMSSMVHPTVFAFMETLSEIDNLPADPAEIPFRNDPRSVSILAANAVRDFCNAWRYWLSWTATGSVELDRVTEAHVRHGE